MTSSAFDFLEKVCAIEGRCKRVESTCKTESKLFNVSLCKLNGKISHFFNIQKLYNDKPLDFVIYKGLKVSNEHFNI